MDDGYESIFVAIPNFLGAVRKRLGVEMDGSLSRYRDGFSHRPSLLTIAVTWRLCLPTLRLLSSGRTIANSVKWLADEKTSMLVNRVLVPEM